MAAHIGPEALGAGQLHGPGVRRLRVEIRLVLLLEGRQHVGRRGDDLIHVGQLPVALHRVHLMHGRVFLVGGAAALPVPGGDEKEILHGIHLPALLGKGGAELTVALRLHDGAEEGHFIIQPPLFPGVQLRPPAVAQLGLPAGLRVLRFFPLLQLLPLFSLAAPPLPVQDLLGGLLRAAVEGSGDLRFILPVFLDVLQQPGEGAVLLLVDAHIRQDLHGAELARLALHEPSQLALFFEIPRDGRDEQGLGPVFLDLPLHLPVVHLIEIVGDDLVPPGRFLFFALRFPFGWGELSLLCHCVCLRMVSVGVRCGGDGGSTSPALRAASPKGEATALSASPEGEGDRRPSRARPVVER